jgi:hypothetical protein
MTTAREMLDLYTEAEKTVLGGQSFRINTGGTDRTLTRADLEQIRAGRREWQARVDGETVGRRSRFSQANFGGDA